MKFYLFAICFLCSGLYSFAQNCTCRDKFSFVKTSIEKNYSGVHDKVNAHTRARYDSLSTYYLKQASQTNDVLGCHLIIYDWMQFFKDGHIQFHSDPYIGVEDSIAIPARISQAEVMQLTGTQLAALKKSKIIEEGIYISDDSEHTVAIIKDKKNDHAFTGVIITSRNPLWKQGQVKLKLLRLDSRKYRALTYRNDHSFKVHNINFTGTSFNNGEWIKTTGNAQGEKVVHEPFSVKDIAAQIIRDSTIYVQIGTFDRTNTIAIDSVFNTLSPLLKRLPNLIIDLRGNGGGDDYSYHSIIPWLYTHPIISTGSDVWSSQSNIDGWQHILRDVNIPEQTKKNIRILVDTMKLHPHAFVHYTDDDTMILTQTEPYPKKVVILTDDGSKSSAEQFVLAARQSAKVTVMGQATGGVLDYANVRQSPPSPCKDILLFYATSRKRHLDKGKAIDKAGITPDITLPHSANWITEAINYLNK